MASQDANRLRATGAILTIGTIPDGSVLTRVGNVIVGIEPDEVAAAAAEAYGTAGPSVYAAENKHTARLYRGQAVAAHSSGSGVLAASAADSLKQCIGLMADTTNVAIAGNVQTSDVLEMADWTLVIGTALLTRGRYFLSTVAGRLTATPPSGLGQVAQVVGYALSTTKFQIAPTVPILL